VAWLCDVVGDLDMNPVVQRITRTVQHPDGTRTVETRAAINLWIKLYQEGATGSSGWRRPRSTPAVAEQQVRLTKPRPNS
jgi:hypothetical protein